MTTGLGLAASKARFATNHGRDASATGAKAFSMAANALWLPAVSMPAALTKDGLPVDLAMFGRPWSDGFLNQHAHLVDPIQPETRTAPT
jgi:Asp-tRNA(Asn)/Glu-tRNA(Gln) amidotransferase A subunit family amidase